MAKAREKVEPRVTNRRLRQAAGDAINGVTKAGARAYDRRRDLPALIRTEPPTREMETAEALLSIVMRLERALRAERNRARSGHWTYDLNRHIALHQAREAEGQRLAALRSRRG